MLHNIWNAVLFRPLVNLLAFFVYLVPGGDVGIAIIALTILVKALLFPLSQRSIESQAKMSVLAPELNKIKSSGKSQEEQAKATLELYKKHNANPFSGCLLILIQIPIIIALYLVFLKGISFDNGILYSFVPSPEKLNTMFLGLIDLSEKSLLLAILAGASQYLQAHFMPKPNNSPETAGTFAHSFSKSMHIQMKYFFPFLIAFIAYSISGAIALYWLVSNLFSTLQQVYANKRKHSMLTVKNSNEQK